MLVNLSLFHLQYDAAILHTTFARLLGPPRTSSMVLCSMHLHYFLEFARVSIITHIRIAFDPNMDMARLSITYNDVN